MISNTQLSLVAPPPRPSDRTSFKRNLNSVEKYALKNGDFKTLLDVGVKTGQGIITPKEGAGKDLARFIDAQNHGDKLGFLDHVENFFLLIARGEDPIDKRANRISAEEINAIREGDPVPSLKFAYEIGKGKFSSRDLGAAFHRPGGIFEGHLKTLSRVVPREITDVKYTLNAPEVAPLALEYKA